MFQHAFRIYSEANGTIYKKVAQSQHLLKFFVHPFCLFSAFLPPFSSAIFLIDSHQFPTIRNLRSHLPVSSVSDHNFRQHSFDRPKLTDNLNHNLWFPPYPKPSARNGSTWVGPPVPHGRPCRRMRCWTFTPRSRSRCVLPRHDGQFLRGTLSEKGNIFAMPNSHHFQNTISHFEHLYLIHLCLFVFFFSKTKTIQKLHLQNLQYLFRTRFQTAFWIFFAPRRRPSSACSKSSMTAARGSWIGMDGARGARSVDSGFLIYLHPQACHFPPFFLRTCIATQNSNIISSFQIQTQTNNKFVQISTIPIPTNSLQTPKNLTTARTPKPY